MRVDNKYYLELYKYFKMEIINGNLLENMKLPSIRQVALKFNLNKATVFRAYELLEKEGYIEKKLGKGTFVNKKINYEINKDYKFLIDFCKYNKNEIDFIGNNINNNYFPIKKYKKYINYIINEYGKSIFIEKKIKENLELKRMISENLEKEDIFVKENNIIISGGLSQSLAIIMRVFYKKNKETNIVISNPRDFNIVNIFKNNCNIKELELHSDGWNLIELEEILKKDKIDFIYETFNFQNPTGIVWSEEKKKKLLDLANRYNFYIIEDNSFSEFYYDTQKPLSIKSMDKNGSEKIIYLYDYSKILGYEINITIIVAPLILKEKIFQEKYILGYYPINIAEKILELLLKNKDLEFLVNKMRISFTKKYYLVRKLLKNEKNIITIHVPRGGFYMWLELNENIHVDLFCKESEKRGVFFLPGKIFHQEKQNKGKIRLCFVSVTYAELRVGIKIMKKLLKPVTTGNRDTFPIT